MHAAFVTLSTKYMSLANRIRGGDKRLLLCAIYTARLQIYGSHNSFFANYLTDSRPWNSL